MNKTKKAIQALEKTRNNIIQLCDMVNFIHNFSHKSADGKKLKVRAEDFLEPLSELDSIFANQDEIIPVADKPVTNPTTRFTRTWANQHPNSLSDLDLSFFNLENKDNSQPSWDDMSWKNDSCPSFSIANGKECALLLLIDYRKIADREGHAEARFHLRAFPRIDDGTSDNYEIDQANGDEPTLYEGNNYAILKAVIKANS